MGNPQFENLRCPHCGGTIARTFSFYEKLGLLFPINFRTYSYFACPRNCAKYLGPRGWGSLVLSLGSSVALGFLSGWTLRLTVCAIAIFGWAIIALAVTPFLRRGDPHMAEVNTMLAGGVIGALFMVAALTNNWPLSQPWHLVFLGFILGLVVFYIDQWTIRPNRLVTLNDGKK